MTRNTTFAAIAALLIAAVTFLPRSVASAMLGQGWQCGQNVMVTSCRHASVQ